MIIETAIPRDRGRGQSHPVAHDRWTHACEVRDPARRALGDRYD
jgi:hypothetical protein